ncbi:hypothetical protein EVAR_37262_1 [Eumeta japonica]|uniref:Uncharacterized protein n=1 Tax=Eumeta variegata TaxID=151549 RepID=A0A4C1WIZ9_EUMVA|nr:hypothetical protein EVAR_37262_1 [Eumeta japonica]
MILAFASGFVQIETVTGNCVSVESGTGSRIKNRDRDRNGERNQGSNLNYVAGTRIKRMTETQIKNSTGTRIESENQGGGVLDSPRWPSVGRALLADGRRYICNKDGRQTDMQSDELSAERRRMWDVLSGLAPINPVFKKRMAGARPSPDAPVIRGP